MSTIAPDETAAPERSLFTGARHAQRMVDALATTSGPPRAFIVGSAGSGKSSILARLRTLLTAQGTTIRVLHPSIDVTGIPADDVLFVDDLHLLPPHVVRAVATRAAAPQNALIVAVRPWPRTDALVEATTTLEHVLPTLVAGRLWTDDVAAYLAAHRTEVPAACLDELIEITGGTTWLVTEALNVHEHGGCTDSGHTALRHHLGDRVAQRLASVDTAVRSAVERICLGDPDPAGITDDVIAHAFSEGLLTRNGSAIPIVHHAVRMSIPLHRLVDISHDTAEIAATVAEDPTHPAWGTVRDAEVGRTLMAESARLLDVDPVRADALCRRALEAGVATAEATIGRARAAWAAGEIDVAASLLEADQPDHGGRPSRLGRMLEAGSDPLIADLRAAIWSARAMMSTADAVYRSMPQQTGRATAHLTAVANGRRTGVGAPASAGSTTRSVALAMLASGLCRTLEPDADPAVLGELARASRLYTSARSGAPLPELPAVVAATAAVGLGETATATNVIDAAITGGQGGRWARRRLLLWGAWIAVQTEQPARARERLGEARRLEHPWTPRDRLLDIAVTVALTRRYDELEDLRVLWDQVRDEIQQATIDLFLILPLATLVSAAARLGDDRTLAPLMTEALQLLAGLGSPPVWAAHLRWAGIQQGILLDRPELLEPHAHALVNAAEHNTVAETMARAGKLWMSVLAGHVDPDAVEAAAAELAGCGLAWDGARLAGHGAARTTDRKTAARLLACARRLHPQDVGHPPAPVETPDEQSPVLNQAGLSDREIEVARLVVQGKTYAEIGKAIFISPRTAEHHIARIRQKLAAESRSDLLSKLRPVLQPEHSATPIPLNPLSNPGAYRGQPRSLTSGGRVASETIAAGRTREERA